MRTIAILTLLIVAGLAGCAESPPAQETHSEPEQPIYAPAGVNVTEVTKNTFPGAKTAILPITAEAPVAGFRFTVPDDVAHPRFEGSSFHYIDLMGNVADAQMDGLIVAAYDLATMTPLSIQLLGSQVTTWLTAALPSTATFAPGPFVMTLPEEMAGQEIGMVVGAIGLSAPGAITLQFYDETGWVNANDVPSSQEMLQASSALLEPIGTSTGAHAEYQTEIHIGLYVPLGLLGAQAVVGEPDITEADGFVRPHGGRIDWQASYESPYEDGYTYSTMAYIAGEGATQWEYGIDFENVSAQDDGLITWGRAYGLIATALVFGLPVGIAAGDHTSAPVMSMDLDGAVTNEVFLFLFGGVSFDAPLEHLLGASAPTVVDVFEGLLILDADRPGRMSVGDTEIAVSIPAP